MIKSFLITHRFPALLTALILILSGSISSFAERTLKVSVLGDSYSTFEKHVDPAWNRIWYSTNNDPQKTDVNDVTQTWWHKLITDKNLKLEKNNSFSGATICHTGYKGKDYSDRSFISRMYNLGDPDIIFIFGATNDSWADSPIGEFKWADWTSEDLYSFRPALTYLLSNTTALYPDSKIIFLINYGLKPEVTNSIKEACGHYGVDYLELSDMDKKANHPSILGMQQIATQIEEQLAEYFDTAK